MYLSQKVFGLIFVAITIVVVGYLAVTNLNKPQENVNLNPSPDTSLFGNSTPPAQQNAPTATSNQPKNYTSAPPTLSPDQLQNKKAVIVTNKGMIEFEIFADTPVAASNFIFLANEHFYDGLKFHRVVPGFVIQGGDPVGNGTGGPGYKFNDEAVKRAYDKGIVAMANSGPNTNGSQFFIMLANNPLPPNYTIFGQVISGQEVVDKIQVGDVMRKVTIEPLK